MLKKLAIAACFGFAILLSSQVTFAKEPFLTDEQTEQLIQDLEKLQEIWKSENEKWSAIHAYIDNLDGTKHVLVIIPLLERVSNHQFFEASNKMRYGIRTSDFAFYPPSYSVRLETNWEIGNKRVDLKLVVETRNNDPRHCSQFTITKYTGEEGRDDALYLSACDSLLQYQSEKRQIEEFVGAFQLLLFETGK